MSERTEVYGTFGLYEYKVVSDEDDGLIPDEDVDCIMDDSIKRIGDMAKEGYTSGELCISVDERSYSGWFKGRN